MSRRLAIFLPLLTGGGAERVTLSLAEGLRAEGVAVDLVVLRAEGPLVPLVPEGVRLVALALPRARAAPRAIARYLQAARPDAMLSVLPEMDVAAALGRLLSRHRPRLVWTVHSMPSALPLLAGRHRARMLRLMLRALLPGVSRVVAVSEGAAAEYRALIGGGARLGTIYNPGPEPRVGPRARRPGPVRIVTAGRLAPEKDQATLLRAFAILRSGRDAHLTIFGDGPLRGALSDQAARLGIADAVAFPGHVLDLAPHFAEADVFALSSRTEALSATLLEAMASGCPVVSTDAPCGPREILEGGRWGRLVPVGAPEDLALALDAALAEGGPDPRPRLAAFDRGRIVSAYLQVLFGPLSGADARREGSAA